MGALQRPPGWPGPRCGVPPAGISMADVPQDEQNLQTQGCFRLFESLIGCFSLEEAPISSWNADEAKHSNPCPQASFM